MLPTFSDQQAGVKRGAIFALLVLLLALPIGYCWIPFNSDVSSPLDALTFALRWQLLLVASVLVGIARVAWVRVHSPDDIAGSGFVCPSQRLNFAHAFLQNTMEQAVVAPMVQLVLATMLRARELVLLPLLVCLFCVGRIFSGSVILMVPEAERLVLP